MRDNKMGVLVEDAHFFHRSRLQGGITRIMETFILVNMKIDCSVGFFIN